MNKELYIEQMKTFFQMLKDSIIKEYSKVFTKDQIKTIKNINCTEDILIDSSNLSSPIKLKDNKIYLSPDYFTNQLITKIRFDNPEFYLASVNKKIADKSNNLSFEELVTFSEELGLSEVELTKAVASQELFKLVIESKTNDLDSEVLVDGIVEYYAHELGKKYNFTVATRKELLPNLEIVYKIKEELDSKFDSMVSAGEIKELINACDSEEIKHQFYALLEEKKSDENTQENKIIEDIIEETTADLTEDLKDISIVQVEEKDFVKLDKKEGESELVEAEAGEVKEVIEDLVEKHPEEEVTGQEVFNALTDTYTAQKFVTPQEVDVSKLDSEQKAELEAIEAETASDDRTVLVNMDEGVYLRDGEEVLSTEVNSDGDVMISKHTEAALDTSGDAEYSATPSQLVENQEMISESEYQKLLNKKIIGEELTEEEKSQMTQYESIEMQRAQLRGGPVLELKSNGFVSTLTIAFISGITVGLAVSMLLLLLPR